MRWLLFITNLFLVSTIVVFLTGGAVAAKTVWLVLFFVWCFVAVNSSCSCK